MNATALRKARRSHLTPPCQEVTFLNGFSRFELLIVLGSLALLALMIIPALANTRPRSQRAVCANHLSRVGRAFNEWAAAHGDRYPTITPTTVEGGLSGHPSGLQNQAWFQFAWISNALATPTILVCPSDTGKRPARDFSFLAGSGFLHPTYQNNAVSYFLGHPSSQQGRALLSGDRNLSYDGIAASCAYFTPVLFLTTPSTTAKWMTQPTFGHGESGNLLFNDGSVEQSDNPGLRRALIQPGLDATAFHFLTP